MSVSTKNEDSGDRSSSTGREAADHVPDGAAAAGSADASRARSDSALRCYFRVFAYCDAVGWSMNAVALFCMIAAGTLLPLMDLVFGKFVTVFNNFATGVLDPEGFRDEVNKYTLFYIYLFIAKFVLTYIWTVLVATSAVRITKALREDFLRQTLRQEIAFFESPDSPSVASQITTNGNLVNAGISEKLGLTIQACSSFVTAFVVAFAVHWKLTLIIVGIVPLNLIITAICVFFDTVYEFKIMGIFTKAGSLAEEAFASIRTIHAFWAYPRLSKKFRAILAEARAVGDKKSIVYVVLFSFEFFAIYSAYGLAFWQGISMYARGEIADPGTIVTVIFAIVVAAQALTQLAPQMLQLSKATAAAQELFTTIDRESKIDSLGAGGVRPSEINGDIELCDVHFSYPSRPDVPILRGLNLSFPANKTTAIVGASGSGKSTIVGLIERWYSTSQGTISLDGVAITDVNIRWLRSNIRLVQQEPTLFTGTVYENVAYGLVGTDMRHVSDEEKRKLVRQACESAFAHEFIEELPEGYETQIGERGATLSGGQRQRIVIARSIISNPRVLLLDEATSALDPKAEKLVQQALNNVAVGRTMVVISHRLSTVQSADNIVVMSNGNAIEQGTHAELMASNGAYARLVRTQDLREGGDGSHGEEGTVKPSADLIRKATTASARNGGPKTGKPSGTESADEGSVNYGLVKCVALIIAEVRAIWFPMFVVAVCCILGGLTFPALAVLFSQVMIAFELQGSEMTDRGNFFSLMFFVVAIGNLVAYALLGWVGNIVAQTIIQTYKQEIFDDTLQQDMNFFDDPQNTTGALASRLSSEPTNLQELISMNFGLLLINVVNLVSSCILAVIAGWKLGLVLVFGAMPPLVFSGYLRIRLEFKLDDDTVERFAASSGVASEAVMAIRTVSSLALENEVLQRYNLALKGIAQRSVKSLGWRMFWFSLSQSVSFLAMALGFWYGARLISYGEYTSSQFYTVFIATIFSGESAAAFFQYGTSITKARTSANYIFNLRRQLSKPRSDLHEPPPRSGPESGSAVSCEDLQFAYPRRPDLKVLGGITTKIEPGQFVAFVGHSGCGKTTMINLLERFYDPTNGRILFDGQDLKELDVEKYRGGLALVQQEPVLYQGSVRENVALGTNGEDPTEEEIVAACKQANIWDFIASLPQGLGTACGSQGLQLSGGQRQRIAIARALVRRPRLLLLDEATSALDTESEKVVKAALDSAAQGRTTIAVAHRLSTVMDADAIFVFSHGRIVESGTHRALLERRGLYYEMCLGQSLDQAA